MSKKKDSSEMFISVFVGVFIIAIFASLAYGYSECEGNYVRGLFWMECIE